MLVAQARAVTLAKLTQFPEWVFAGLLLAVALRLVLPSATLDQPNFIYVRAYANETTWAMMLGWVGTIRVIAMMVSYFRQSCTWSLHARAIIAFPSAFLMGKMGYLIHRANPDAIVPVFCFSVALADAAILYLLAYQAGHQSKRPR